MDLYKSVDRFIKDAYSSEEGVSEYINQMEQNDYRGSRHVDTWNTDYNKLKRLRWIRNQLSHEVGYDSDICEEADYDWLKEFYDRLYSAEDPMAILTGSENAERRAAEQRRRQSGMQEQNTAAYAQTSYSRRTGKNLPKRKTLWQRIKDFFLI